ncbi:hypothetical protein G4B88_022176 [Cannabis sativa]|uniref:Ubiquitin-like protease family profile domain-containing protein n=1 Tax=Cannabis sativa TaxID=3483 RepID=A0A7J6FGH6_CANSA|nr:hypothetical protein G4B88_022176 [Cannabis sativa]
MSKRNMKRKLYRTLNKVEAIKLRASRETRQQLRNSGLSEHWMLIIIDFDHQICYYSDSLANLPPEAIKSLISRMMKDFLINEDSMRWLTSNCGGKTSYTKDEINKVRDEWAQYITEFMKST